MKLILASNNKGKIREITEILCPFGVEVISMRDAGITKEIEENGTTFAENAAIKATEIYHLLNCPVLADDSGLVVDALDGAPGVYSHRFAGENATDADRNHKLLSMLDGKPEAERTARFVCSLCYIDENGEKHTFDGTCEGVIGTEPKGENGFGYDPIFYRNGVSLAQMSQEEKNAISHRGNALALLKEYFTSL